jgi:hypothetical protein
MSTSDGAGSNAIVFGDKSRGESPGLKGVEHSPALGRQAHSHLGVPAIETAWRRTRR